MPIRKPVERTIHGHDFLDKAYSFFVESVLSPDKSPGIVLVSASAGYLLTTSLTNQPKREHIIRYSRQSDNGWIASDVVTLLISGESLVNGTVVIRDSSAETVVLTVAAVTSLERLDSPSLTVSQPALTFTGALPGKPSFQVLSIAQHHSNAPVTLTTDAPDYFQLASDGQPAFSSTLTLTPSPVGTYVHVRYVADRHGSHTGQLTIHGSSGHETVALKGRNTRRLPAVLSSSPNPGTLLKRGAGLVALIAIMGLAYASYDHRCELFPTLCQDRAINQPINKVSTFASANASDDFSKKKLTSREKTRTALTKPVQSPTRQVSVRTLTDRPVQQPISDVINEQQNVAASRSVARSGSRGRTPADQGIGNAINERPRRRVATPVPPTEQSELERELNKDLQN